MLEYMSNIGFRWFTVLYKLIERMTATPCTKMQRHQMNERVVQDTYRVMAKVVLNFKVVLYDAGGFFIFVKLSVTVANESGNEYFQSSEQILRSVAHLSFLCINLCVWSCQFTVITLCSCAIVHLANCSLKVNKGYIFRWWYYVSWQLCAENCFQWLALFVCTCSFE